MTKQTIATLDTRVNRNERDVSDLRGDIANLRQDIGQNAVNSTSEHKEINNQVASIREDLIRLVTRQNIGASLLVLIGGAILGSIHWEKVFGG